MDDQEIIFCGVIDYFNRRNIINTNLSLDFFIEEIFLIKNNFIAFDGNSLVFSFVNSIEKI